LLVYGCYRLCRIDLLREAAACMALDELLANKSSSSSNRSSGVRGEGAAKKAVCKTRFSSLLGPMDSETEKGF
jgi:hypothetical protein